MALGQVQARRRPATGEFVLGGTVDLVRDRDLVEQCQAGDCAAFEELYHRYHRRLFHFCLRRLYEPYESEDAVQESFTRAWRAMPGFAGERRFYPWLTVIAGNVCTDVLRKRSRLTPVAEVPLPTIDLGSRDVDERLVEEVDGAMALQALGHLSERHRRVLQLREGSGWSTQRIAEQEGVAVPAIETLLWRARQALKREFAALAETGGRSALVLGLGMAAFRRFAGRAVSRVAERLPALQSASLRGPGALVASLALAGGVVGGAVLVANPHPSHPTAVAMPPSIQTAAAPSTPWFRPAPAAPTGSATVQTPVPEAAVPAGPATTRATTSAQPIPSPPGGGGAKAAAPPGGGGGEPSGGVVLSPALPSGSGSLPVGSGGGLVGGLGGVSSTASSAVNGVVGGTVGGLGAAVTTVTGIVGESSGTAGDPGSGTGTAGGSATAGGAVSSVVDPLGIVLNGIAGSGAAGSGSADGGLTGGMP